MEVVEEECGGADGAQVEEIGVRGRCARIDGVAKGEDA